MNFIFGELKVLKEQQASDFQATMLALGTTRDTTNAVARNLDSLSGNLDSVQAAMEAQNRTAEARLDKMEEAVRVLEVRTQSKGEAS